MGRKIIIAAVIVVAFVALAVVWPKSTCNASDSSCNTVLSSQEQQSKADIIKNEVQSGTALLIDVREPDEFAAGHAELAILVPLGDIESGKLSEPDETKQIYLYCQSGRRAGLARIALEKLGYENVEILGDLTDWQDMGGKVVE